MSPAILFLLASIPLRLTPAVPTVGDVVRVESPGRRIVSISGEVEVVRKERSAITIRSLRPGDRRVIVEVSSHPSRRFSFFLPVKSVLIPDDQLQPSPLIPPRVLERNRVAESSIIIAAAVAIALWGIVLLLKRKPRAVAAALPSLSPAEAYRNALATLAKRSDRAAAVQLADATRVYLAAVEPRLAPELTSAEIYARIRALSHESLIHEILSSGDFAKFAPWQMNHDPALTANAAALLDLAMMEEEKVA